jgi:hypothetical protein
MPGLGHKRLVSAQSSRTEPALVVSGGLTNAVADQVFGPFVLTKRHGTIVRSTVPFILRSGGVSAR